MHTRWLPREEKTDGDWLNEVEPRLYSVFEQDFKREPVFLGEMIVHYDRRILSDYKYEEGFYHIISRKNSISGEREPEFSRARKIRWCRSLIDNSTSDEVLCWNYRDDRGRLRRYLWLRECDYVAIFELRPGRKTTIANLVTAYCVDGPRTRTQLEQRYNQREKE